MNGTVFPTRLAAQSQRAATKGSVRDAMRLWRLRRAREERGEERRVERGRGVGEWRG